MLRINLLPTYVFEKNVKLYHALAALIPILAVIGLCGFWYMGAAAAKKAADQRLADANNQSTIYNSWATKITAEQSDVATIQSQQTFVANAKTNNASWPDAITAIAQDIPPYILVNSLTFGKTPNMVTLDCFAKSEADEARWWNLISKDTAKFSAVKMALPEHPYLNNGGSQANQAGGMYGGMGGGGFGGKAGRPGIMAGGLSTAGGGAPAGGAPGPGGFGGPPGYGGPGGFGGNNQKGSVKPTEIQGKAGIEFTATLILRKKYTPSTPPSWPPPASTSNSNAGGPGSFGGMMGGPPGGMMGGPPPGMGGPPAGANDGQAAG